MIWIFFLALFLVTILGGLIPIYLKLNDHWNQNILACSGAILLGITFLHLLPEAFANTNSNAGVYILIGFFLQLLLQKYSHGLEHGHLHHHEGHTISLMPIFIGLGIHAFLEGIPLGYNFRDAQTIPSLFLGVAAHKAPEAITLMSVVSTLGYKKIKSTSILLLFSFITPFAGILAYQFGGQYSFTSNLLSYIVPVVIGAFIHIATTIFFESGTKQHEMIWQKVISIILGLGIACLTMLGE
jgi:zinc and cadmium transporter